jgi:UDP-N-acetylglucosamine 4-epimerase
MALLYSISKLRTSVYVTDVNISPLYAPERKGDIKHSNADISKARALLGYDPKWSFEDGIREAIQWYKESLL